MTEPDSWLAVALAVLGAVAVAVALPGAALAVASLVSPLAVLGVP